MGMPGRETLDADLEQLKKNGIGALVSLTEERLPDDEVRNRGLEYVHIPIRDFDTPTFRQIEEFVGFVDGNIRDGRAACVHCTAGLGRTGTMLACYLVSRGTSAFDAINRVRAIRPGSIETLKQEQVIEAWEVHLTGKQD